MTDQVAQIWVWGFAIAVGRNGFEAFVHFLLYLMIFQSGVRRRNRATLKNHQIHMPKNLAKYSEKPCSTCPIFSDSRYQKIWFRIPTRSITKLAMFQNRLTFWICKNFNFALFWSQVDQCATPTKIIFPRQNEYLFSDKAFHWQGWVDLWCRGISLGQQDRIKIGILM